jgi:hypothetical protein
LLEPAAQALGDQTGNGTGTVDEIADLFNRDATPVPKDEIVRAFSQYFEQGLLNWHDR